MMSQRRYFTLALLALIAVCWFGKPGWTVQLPLPSTVQPSELIAVEPNSGMSLSEASSPEELLRQGRSHYEAGQLTEATNSLQQAVAAYRQQGNSLGEAIALSNLALVTERSGAWQIANSAIAQSLAILEASPLDPTERDRPSVLAQALDVQGQLQLAQGQAEAALATWERAAQWHTQVNNPLGMVRNQIRQVQALQVLGFHQQAVTRLEPLQADLQRQPDSALKVVILRHLGNAYQLVGRLDEAQVVLNECKTVAIRLGLNQAIAAAELDLANVVRSQATNYRSVGEASQAEQASQTALDLYAQVANRSESTLTRLQAQLNQLSLLIDLDRLDQTQFWSEIRPQVNALPMNQSAIYARINFAHSLIRLKQAGRADLPNWLAIAQDLDTARQQAHTLGNQRAEAYALGYVGWVYEQARQWDVAQQFTDQALFLAQEINANDVAYRWFWQKGRLFVAQTKTEEAIAAYQSAVNTLASLRKDLIAVNSDVQFSFRESVEPVYRELVSLLLKQNNETPNESNLSAARAVIEQLQREEVTNFLRAACLEPLVEVDQVEGADNVAVIYPIILSDRLEMIVSMPNQPLQQKTVLIEQSELEQLVEETRLTLYNFIDSDGFRPFVRRLYDLLMRPLEPILATSSIQTLVFVPDGVLRNVPMAALYDGEQFLIEKYSIAFTPGLNLLVPKPLQQEKLSVVAVGLSEVGIAEENQDFLPLQFVETELAEIQKQLPTQRLLNQEFTQERFEQILNASPSPIVHLATHGQFSSEQTNTFVLTWNGKLNMNDLSRMIRQGELKRAAPIELLVFSACETASGDQRAALGLAGVAIRAGARSTIASLWQVDDAATALMMEKFYQAIASQQVSKAEALRQAQLAVLEDPLSRRHPYNWAPFVLVGNWL